MFQDVVISPEKMSRSVEGFIVDVEKCQHRNVKLRGRFGRHLKVAGRSIIIAGMNCKFTT